MAYPSSAPQSQAFSIGFSYPQLCLSVLVLQKGVQGYLDRGRQSVPAPVSELCDLSEATVQEVWADWTQLVGATLVVQGLAWACPGLRGLAVTDWAEVAVAFYQRFQDLREEHSCPLSGKRAVARFVLGTLLMVLCQEAIALGVDHTLNWVVDPSEIVENWESEP